MARNYTLKDNNRRNYTFADHHQVEQVLPDYFKTEYPKLIKLLEYYYQFEDSDQSPSRLIHDVMLARDITANDISLLTLIEDELLLGQSYFEGFQNKRAAAKYSNTLYKSKGTLYGIQQFFRTFYGTNPEISYPKEQRFIVGEDTSRIGSESLRFLTDDKLYQVFALLIKADIPIAEWRDAYKLFVHPAGMYIGSEVLIEAIVSNVFNINMPDYVAPANNNPQITSVATLSTYEPAVDMTGIVDSDGVNATRRDAGRGVYGKLRSDLSTTIRSIQDLTLDEIMQSQGSLRDLISPSSVTFDADSSGDKVTRLDQTISVFDTFDDVEYNYYDSDSA